MDMLETYLKRKLEEEFIDVSEEDGDVNHVCGVKKKKKIGPEAEEEKEPRKAAKETVFSSRSKDFDDASDDGHRSGNKMQRQRRSKRPRGTGSAPRAAAVRVFIRV